MLDKRVKTKGIFFRVLCITTVLLAWTFCVVGCNRSQGQSAVTLPAIAGQSTVPVVSVYIFPGWSQPENSEQPLGPKTIVAIWPDGRIVWSKDSLKGGPPYYQARLRPAQVSDLVDTLRQLKVFENPKLKELKYGPDSRYTAIVIIDGRRTLEMGSWHELFEANPKLVATAQGVETLGSRSRNEVLAAQPKDYKEYRKKWLEVRTAIARLIPREGQLLSNIQFEFRQYSVGKRSFEGK